MTDGPVGDKNAKLENAADRADAGNAIVCDARGYCRALDQHTVGGEIVNAVVFHDDREWTWRVGVDLHTEAVAERQTTGATGSIGELRAENSIVGHRAGRVMEVDHRKTRHATGHPVFAR